MKYGSATKKIPGGKLLRIDVAWAEQIESVKITGDFFLHPEETINDLETAIRGQRIPLLNESMIAQLEDILRSRQAELVGASIQDLVAVLTEAIQCSSE